MPTITLKQFQNFVYFIVNLIKSEKKSHHLPKSYIENLSTLFSERLEDALTENKIFSKLFRSKEFLDRFQNQKSMYSELQSKKQCDLNVILNCLKHFSDIVKARIEFTFQYDRPVTLYPSVLNIREVPIKIEMKNKDFKLIEQSTSKEKDILSLFGEISSDSSDDEDQIEINQNKESLSNNSDDEIIENSKSDTRRSPIKISPGRKRLPAFDLDKEITLKLDPQEFDQKRTNNMCDILQANIKAFQDYVVIMNNLAKDYVCNAEKIIKISNSIFEPSECDGQCTVHCNRLLNQNGIPRKRGRRPATHQP